jgi:hypothetical protein
MFLELQETSSRMKDNKRQNLNNDCSLSTDEYPMII